MAAGDDDLALAGAVLQQRLRLLRLVGAGGIGVVYEAAPLSGEGRLAVKLLRRELRDDEVVVARFLGESAASARIDHPGVVHTLDQGRAEDGTPYLVMPLLAGEPLSRTMNRGRVPVQRATAITAALLDALAVAHAAGVVHRDLKPDNVFLVEGAAGVDEVRILDFGLARVIDVAGGAARRTSTGMLLGTPGYMSPEQVRNAKEVGPLTDLWAVAIMLFEMLVGARAYAAANEFERMTKVLTEAPPSIARAAPQYAHWEAFFARALAREPRERFPDAPSMLAALEQVSRGRELEPVSMGAPGQSGLASPVGATVSAASVPVGTVTTGPVPVASAPVAVALVPGASPAGAPVAGPVLTPAPLTPPLRGSSATTGPFGGVPTAISPGAAPTGAEPGVSEGNPNVQVVRAAPRGYSLAALLAVALATWLLGLVAGYLVGSR